MSTKQERINKTMIVSNSLNNMHHRHYQTKVLLKFRHCPIDYPKRSNRTKKNGSWKTTPNIVMHLCNFVHGLNLNVFVLKGRTITKKISNEKRSGSNLL